MKAVICRRYGPPEVLELTERPKPRPGPGEVLVRIRATTVHVGDTRIRAFRVPPAAWLPARLFLGLLGPRKQVLGMELAGVVEEIGPTVERFAVGDEVVGDAGFGFGAYAEYICLPEQGRAGKDGMVALKPPNLTFEQAAPLACGAITALGVLRKADIQPGQRVLVYGASGSVGTYAVQLARHHFGAEVTAVCSGANLELVRSLGAIEAIDYTRDDFADRGPTWDVVFDAVDKAPKRRAKSALAPGGVYLNVDSSSDGLKLGHEDLELLCRLAEQGAIRTVIDRTLALEEIVEGHRYVDQGHKRGNVAVTVGLVAG